MTEIDYPVNETVKGQEVSYALMGDNETATGYAILSFIKESEKNFPRRFSHHTSFKDSSVALANLSADEKLKMKANLLLMQLFEMAAKFRFEMEKDYFFFQDLINEETYFAKNLSLGDGSLLNVLKTTMRIIDVGSNQQEKEVKKGWSGFFGRR